MKKPQTEVISFRESKEVAIKVRKEAKKKKLTRSEFVSKVFNYAFDNHLQDVFQPVFADK